MEKCQNQNFLGKNGKILKKGYFSPNTMKLYPKVGQYQKIAFFIDIQKFGVFRTFWIIIYVDILGGSPY